MSDLRTTIMENDLRVLKGQMNQLEEMVDFQIKRLTKAYMEADASLTEEDAILMIEDID